MEREPVGVRHVHRDEISSALHKICDERHVARQPVELGDNQCGLLSAARVERGSELGAVGSLPRLHLSELGKYVTATLGDIVADGFALGLQAQT